MCQVNDCPVARQDSSLLAAAHGCETGLLMELLIIIIIIIIIIIGICFHSVQSMLCTSGSDPRTYEVT